METVSFGKTVEKHPFGELLTQYRRRKAGKGEDASRVQIRLFDDAKSRADKLRAVPLTLEPIKRDSKP